MDVSALNLGMIAAYYNISCECRLLLKLDHSAYALVQMPPSRCIHFP